MSASMEDTMDVDDDNNMQMDEDPTVGELPMSTDEDSVQDAAGVMKVVDDVMASDSPSTVEVEGPTEMDADPIGDEVGGTVSTSNNPPLNTLIAQNVPTDSRPETDKAESLAENATGNAESLAENGTGNAEPLAENSTGNAEPLAENATGNAESLAENSTGDSGLSEGANEVDVAQPQDNLDKTSSEKNHEALQGSDKNDEESSSSETEDRLQDFQTDDNTPGNEGTTHNAEGENDPLVDCERGSRSDLDQVETSNQSTADDDTRDPLEAAVSVNNNSDCEHEESDPSHKENDLGKSNECPAESISANQDKTCEDTNDGVCLADELNEQASKFASKQRVESENDENKDKPANDDHISLDGSSAEDDEVELVSLDGSSDGERNLQDHVSVDSDSDHEEGKDAPSSGSKPDDKDEQPEKRSLDHTVPIEFESEQNSASGNTETPPKSNVSSPSGAQKATEVTEGGILCESAAPPKQISTSDETEAGPASHFVVSDDETETVSDDQPIRSKPSESFKGQITLIGKASDSEMIVGPVAGNATSVLHDNNTSPSASRSSSLSDSSQVFLSDASKLAAKSHYSVKKIANLTHSKCLQCATNQRCPWKVSIGMEDYFICSDKCLEAHRVQRRQILENGAPPMSSIVQTADLSSLSKKCSYCLSVIPKNHGGSLTWEVMDFCDDDCLSKYQTKFTSNCCNCNAIVATSSMGKYCVRFGHEVKQFCSPSCLDTYKKGIKTCSYCQKNLQNSTDGFLAAVGGKDQFRDFCSQDCLEKYDCICNNSGGTYSVDSCIVCDNTKVTQFELLSGPKVAKLCSDVCLAAYKFVNNIEVGVCGMCNKYYDTRQVDESITFHHDTPSTFCSKHCMNISVISKRKIVPCAWCKAKKYNFDMVYRRGFIDDDGLFVCSVNCLALHSVSLKAIPPRKVVCAYCRKLEISTYHITMSDATVRHFCGYECVNGFRTTFSANSNVPFPEVVGAPKKVTKSVDATVANNSSPSMTSGLAIHSVSTLKHVGDTPPPLAPTSNAAKVKHTTLKIPSSFCFKPTEMRNKWTQISVCQVAKCISCRPKTEARDTQCSLSTETMNGEQESTKDSEAIACDKVVASSSSSSVKAVIPIPVPIYVPYPMAMFTLPSPVPMPIPVPIILPIIVPTALDNMEQVIDSMKEFLAKSVGKSKSPSKAGPSSTCDEVLQMALDNMDNESNDRDHNGDNRRKRALEVTDDDDDVDEFNNRNLDEDVPSKKSRLDDQSPEQEPSSPPTKMKLKHTLGLTTWKYFAKTWNESVEEEDDRLKVDLLSMRTHELSIALALFIREAKKANGDDYRADLKFYLGLCIQYYLLINGRVDDIFGDTTYDNFTDALDVEARKFLAEVDVTTSRVEEEHLWESMQLGAKSPQVLLMTLMYFNTLHLNLWTVEEHMELSFCSFELKSYNEKNPGSRNSGKYIKLLVNNSTGDGLDSKKPKEMMLTENKKDFMRCPVRFYEFYLTKCPENVKNQSDRFYLMPESSCIPESPVWYRSLALPRQMVEKMLNRVKMIKEICESIYEHSDSNSSTDLEPTEQ